MKACVLVFFLFISFSCSDFLSNIENKTVEETLKKEGVEYVFDEEALPVINIQVSSYDWNELLEKYDMNKDIRDYIQCNFSFTKGADKSIISDAGVRLHGNTSRRRPEGAIGEKHDSGGGKFNHSHYMVNLRKYVKDDLHELQGVRKIIFKWFHNDPSYVREIYCYDLFRRYGIWTIANSSYCRMFIQVDDEAPVYLGVYGMFEAVDKQYLKRRKNLFEGSSGFLWKCVGVGLNDITDDLFFVDDNSTDVHLYELKEDVEEFNAAKKQFKHFISNFQNLTGKEFVDWISSVCDVEFLLKTYAVNVACGMWDDYWNNSNNFYVYFNSKDSEDYKFFFIPYDYDESLGRTSACGVQKDAVTHNPIKWGKTENNLISKLIEYPAFRKIYIEALHELATSGNGFLEYNSSIVRISKWHDLVGPYVSNDTGQDMVIEDVPGMFSDQQDYKLWEPGRMNFFNVKCETLLKVE